MIVWREEMCVGIASVDDDHKKLIEIINEFETSKSRKAAELTAKRLFAYTNTHFKREEDLQSEYLYPLRHEQKAQHATIVRDLRLLIRSAFIDTKRSDADVIANLSELMREWIVDHVIQSDMKMKQFFKSSGIL